MFAEALVFQIFFKQALKNQIIACHTCSRIVVILVGYSLYIITEKKVLKDHSKEVKTL